MCVKEPPVPDSLSSGKVEIKLLQARTVTVKDGFHLSPGRRNQVREPWLSWIQESETERTLYLSHSP